MLTIIHHIEYLLRRNDCVVVPGFGAFVVQTRAAGIDEAGEMLLPPSRMLSFNGAIDHNDGMLASSIMRKESVSYDKAVDVLASEVKSLKNQLVADKELMFGKLGMFRLSEEGQMVFEPSATFDLCRLPYYGLPAVSLSAAERRDVAVRKDVSFSAWGKNAMRIAASIAVLLVFAFTLTTPIYMDQMPDYAGVMTLSEKPKQSKPAEVKPMQVEMNGNTSMEEEKPMDAHLMIIRPENYVERFSRSGVSMLSFHLNATETPDSVIDMIHRSGMKAGVAINPDIPVESLFPYLDRCDYVLLMSVFAGFGGQKFIEETYGRLVSLKSEITGRGLSCLIEVDGGVSGKNAAALAAAGADILVAGSAVFKSDDPAGVISSMR